MKKLISIILLCLFIGGSGLAIMSFLKGHSKYIETQEIENNAIKNIEVNASIVDVFVEPSQDDQFHLEHITNNKDHKMEVIQEGDTLYVNSKMKKLFNFNFNFNFNNKETMILKITVPKRVMNQLKISNSVGDIHVKDFEGKEIKINTSTGNINLVHVFAHEIKTTSTVGDITLEETSGDIIAKASTGNINIHPNKEMNMEVKTSVGDIKITFPNELTNTKITGKTSVGDVKVFGKENEETVFGKGENFVKTKTSTGDIHIQYKK